MNIKQGGIKYPFLSLRYDLIEPRSPGPLANTLAIIPMSSNIKNYLFSIGKLDMSLGLREFGNNGDKDVLIKPPEVERHYEVSYPEPPSFGGGLALSSG